MTIEAQARELFGEPNAALSSGVEMRFGRQGSKSVNLETGEWFDFEEWKGGHFEESKVELAPNVARMVVNRYTYCDEHGEVRYEVMRYMPKFFEPRAFVDGQWRRGKGCMDRIERLPYRLPAMLASDYVIVVEGEKDVDRLHEAGLVATTKSGGAQSSWEPSALRWFRDKDVFVIPDNDDAGRRGAEKTCAALEGIARSVVLAPVCDGMPAKSDVSDWLDADKGDLLAAVRTFPEFNAAELDASFVYNTLDADEITPVLSADDFVEGVLIAGGMSVVYGASNVGKTFFAADLALHVALGWQWRGREVEAGPVLYVAAEGSYGIRNRVAAFRSHYEIEGKVPFHVIPVSVNLLNDDEAVERLINTARVKGASMVVLDTLARVIAGGNENSSEDMGALIGNCDRIRAETRAHVMLIHHTGKDEARGARGHSSLRAATDTEIEVASGLNGSVATVTKQRDLEIDGTFGFSLHVVPLGVNTRGKEVSSCVVMDASVATQKRKRRPSGKVQKTVLKALTNALIDSGVSVADSRGRIVTEEQWKNEAFKVLSGESKHKSTAFRRAADNLIGDEFVGYRDGVAWVLE